MPVLARGLRSLLLSLLVLLLATGTAGAVTPPAENPKPAKTRTPLSEIANTPEPDATKQSWQVNARGAFSDTIPIAVPPFRDLTPRLSLTYESSSGNGWTGVGWSLDGVSRVERVGAGRGAPRYDATDVHVLDGDELVACAAGSTSPSCTTGGTHTSKNESYARIALTGTGSASRWTVTAKDGTRRVFAPSFLAGTDLVFRWGLNQVVDTDGNTVTYNWASNAFACCWDHLDSVAYNGTTVKLHYETRPDTEQEAIGNGAFTTVAGRVKTIDVAVDGNRVRAYQLSYTTSGATSRSLLTGVRQFGRDAVLDASGTVTGGTAMPAMTSTFQSGGAAFGAAGSDAVLGPSTNAKRLPVDINGDGKTDMLELYPNWTVYELRSWLSDGTGFALGAAQSTMSYGTNNRHLTGDVNGDGKGDIIELYPNGFAWGRRVWLSNGSGFAVASTGTTHGGYKTTSRFVTLDVNGDGKVDMLELYQCGIWPVHFCRATWLSDGTTFTEASHETGITYDVDKQFYPLDVNGDGKQDLLELYPAGWGAGGRRIWLSTGTGFTAGAADTAMGWVAQTAAGAGSRFEIMDVNGDDKTDMVELLPAWGTYTRRVWLSTGYSFALGSTDTAMTYSTSAKHIPVDVNGDQRLDLVEIGPCCLGTGAQRRVWISTGTGFTPGATDTSLNPYSCDDEGKCTSEFLEMDVNGDGRIEMVELHSASFGWVKGRRVWKVGGAQPDLLTSRTDEWGATTSVAFAPSADAPNTNNPPIVPTAAAVTVADGRGTAAVTRYSYAGGAFDWSERQFLGFRTVKETKPCNAGESACPYTETRYRQELGALLHPERIDRRGGDGALLSSTIHEYALNTTVPRTALPTGTWENSYANGGAACPGADCRREYTTRQYNAYGEITQQVEHGDNEVVGDERTTTTTYVPNTAAYVVASPSSVTTSQGVGPTSAKLAETRSSYDGLAWNQPPTRGHETRAAQWLDTTNAFVETGKEYDAWGNVVAEVDPLGARTTIGYDARHHVFSTSETNALGQAAAAGWDVGCATPTRVTDSNGQATTLTYDPLCRLAEKTEPAGRFERHTWVDQGNAATQHQRVERPSADGTDTPQWTIRYIDGLQRPWRTVDKGPDAATGDIHVDTAYTARGQIASKTAPYYWVAGAPQPTTHPTTSTYDGLDRLTKEVLPGGATRTTGYGPWSTTTTDERGHATTERVNADGRRVATEQTVNGTTRTATYVHDLRGSLVRSTDPAGGVITYTTDSLSRTTKMVDPNSGSTLYEWDAAGRLVAQTDAKGQRSTFRYDALGRKTGKTSRAGTAGAVSASWTYDQVRAGFHNVGRLTTTTDAAGTKTSDHDALGRVVKAVRTINGTGYAFRYGFDANDRALWTVYPDGDAVGSEAAPVRYDGAGRLLSIPGYVTAARYDAAGELIRIENANGTVTTRPHDAQRGWLTGITTTSGTTKVQDNTYTRDAGGKITRVSSPFANESWTYAYDDAGQLTGTTNSSDQAHSQTMGYDAAGNITANSRLGVYAYASAKPHAVTSAGGNSYGYDAAGLMTSGAGRTLTWDGDNRLASVTRNGTTTSYTYDADGARLQQVEGATTRRYLGDDYEVDVTAGSTTKYVSIAGTLVARKNGATRHWVHVDQQGSVQAVTDGTGTEVHRKKYRAFGEVLSTAGPLAFEARGYTGERQDSSGLVWLKARFYDPEIGRFVSPNPVVDGEAAIGLNRYAYAANDPVNHTDPSGLDCEKGSASCDKDKDPEPEPPVSKALKYVFKWQENGYYCGPAAVQMALSAMGHTVSQDELAAALGTTTDGTRSVEDITRVLNEKTGTSYFAPKWIGGSTADQAQKDQLKRDVLYNVTRDKPLVVNIVGRAEDTDGDSHSYMGGHYIAVVGYEDNGNVVRIADSADENHVGSYTMTTDRLAVWAAGRGYSA